MYARTSEETYTLAEAKRIINEEKLQKRELLLHKAKQKLLGIITIGISIIILCCLWVYMSYSQRKT